MCEFGSLDIQSLKHSAELAPPQRACISLPVACSTPTGLQLATSLTRILSILFLVVYVRAEAKFIYDLSPIAVSYVSASRHWYDYMTSIMAIIGGVFTVFGMMESGINAAVSRKKRM